MTVLWRNSLGDPVDLTDIDRRYALNILHMVLVRKARCGYTPAEIADLEIVKILRDTVLNGREPNVEDRDRAVSYNKANEAADLPFRADTAGYE